MNLGVFGLLLMSKQSRGRDGREKIMSDLFHILYLNGSKVVFWLGDSGDR